MPEQIKSSTSGIIGLVVFALLFWAGCKACGGCSEEAAVDKPVTRQERVQQLFSAWDGSQPAVVDWIKQNLNDPNSFEHLETKFIDRKDTIAVVTEFTAKNAFGGRVRSTCIAYIDSLGNFLYGEIH
ncbi:MAG: hypothetical protein JSS64_03540 [Bacteroidetes bacterium]|nr:hypothetical protein [Bacteroidota bacterium]